MGPFDAVIHKLRESVAGPQPDEGFQSALEMVVDGTDSRIRLVSGYRRKLQKSVRNALGFVNELVAQIPAAIEVSNSTFITNPYVNAFFTNVGAIHSTFNSSSEIRDFMEDYGSRNPRHCCCLLCMHRSEKRVLGMELAGDMLMKDVQQTAVSFSDHRIYSPAPNEAAARDGLRACLLGGLVNKALEHIMHDKAENYRLQSERHMLHLKLRHLENRSRELPAEATAGDEISVTRGKIQAVEAELMNLRPVTPQESLNHVNHLFERPEKFIRLKRAALKLDKMGIVIDANSRQASNSIDLAEVTIGDEPPRVVTLANFPVDEFSGPAAVALPH